MTLENFKTLRDLGPLSVSSYYDTRKKAAIMMSHRFKTGLTMDLNGNTMLTRSEYLDTVANPRDRDALLVRATVHLRLRNEDAAAEELTALLALVPSGAAAAKKTRPSGSTTGSK